MVAYLFFTELCVCSSISSLILSGMAVQTWSRMVVIVVENDARLCACTADYHEYARIIST